MPDGDADIADFFFLDAFARGDMNSRDLNDDGVWDRDDFLLFTDLFTS